MKGQFHVSLYTRLKITVSTYDFRLSSRRENFALLEYYIVHIGSYLPTFREYLTVAPSRVKQSMKVGPLALEDGPYR